MVFYTDGNKQVMKFAAAVIGLGVLCVVASSWIGASYDSSRDGWKGARYTTVPESMRHGQLMSRLADIEAAIEAAKCSCAKVK